MKFKIELEEEGWILFRKEPITCKICKKTIKKDFIFCKEFGFAWCLTCPDKCSSFDDEHEHFKICKIEK